MDHLICNVPDVAVAGSYNITLTVGSQVMSTDPGPDFNMFSLTGVTPAYAPLRGGTAINITGSNFVDVTGEFPAELYMSNFGGVIFELEVTSSTTLSFTTVEKDTGAESLTPFIRLNSQQWNQVPSSLIFYDPPVVEGVHPQSGPVWGGTSFSVAGQFYPTGAVSVALDTEFYPVCHYVNSVELACTSPLVDRDDTMTVEVSVDLSDPVYVEITLNNPDNPLGQPLFQSDKSLYNIYAGMNRVV